MFYAWRLRELLLRSSGRREPSRVSAPRSGPPRQLRRLGLPAGLEGMAGEGAGLSAWDATFGALFSTCGTSPAPQTFSVNEWRSPLSTALHLCSLRHFFSIVVFSAPYETLALGRKVMFNKIQYPEEVFFPLGRGLQWQLPHGEVSSHRAWPGAGPPGTAAANQ